MQVDMCNLSRGIPVTLIALVCLGSGCVTRTPSLPTEVVRASSPGLMLQETDPADEVQGAMKADKSGTNPINFQNELRLYHEYQKLNTAGDGDQNISTLEYRTPIFGGDFQLRIKQRRTAIRADLDDDGSDDVSESGFGDTDVRLLTVPYLDMPNKRALAIGIEAFLNTASDDETGSGANVLGPQVFGVFFKPLGGFFDLIAPAYQHKFTVEKERGRSSIHQGIIDLFALKMSEDKQRWMMINPTAVFDYKNSKEFLLVELEIGSMLDSYLGTKGHSAYLRPGLQVGADRPADYTFEIGYKVIW